MERRYPTGSIELLVREESGRSSGADFVDWAVRALVEGFDSAALRMLAGADGMTSCDAKLLFDRAASELRLEFPASKEARLRTYLSIIASEIVDGSRQPIDALDLIHAEVLGPLNHPKDLMAWCYLWEGARTHDLCFSQ